MKFGTINAVCIGEISALVSGANYRVCRCRFTESVLDKI